MYFVQKYLEGNPLFLQETDKFNIIFLFGKIIIIALRLWFFTMLSKYKRKNTQKKPTKSFIIYNRQKYQTLMNLKQVSSSAATISSVVSLLIALASMKIPVRTVWLH